MTKTSSIPKAATYYKDSQAKEEDEEEEEEEDDMASHSTEDPVRPRAHFACFSTAMYLDADSLPKV